MSSIICAARNSEKEMNLEFSISRDLLISLLRTLQALQLLHSLHLTYNSILPPKRLEFKLYMKDAQKSHYNVYP